MNPPPRPAPTTRDPARARVGPDEVPELGAVGERIVEVARLRSPRVQLGLTVAVAVFAAVCVAATITRFSAWPLLPLAPLAVAGGALLRLRAAGGARPMLCWTIVVLTSLTASLWLMAVVERLFA